MYQPNHKERRTGALILLTIQIIGWVVGSVIFFRYYENLTVETGAAFINTTYEHQSSVNTRIPSRTVDADDSHYEWIFGTINISEKLSNNDLFMHVNKRTEIVQLDTYKLSLAKQLIEKLQTKQIDPQFAYYLLSQDKDNLPTHIDNINRLLSSVDFSYEPLVPDTLTIKEYSNMIKQWDRTTVIKTIRHTETILQTLLRSANNDQTVTANFMKHENFTYLYDKFIVDTPDHFSSHIAHASRLFKVDEQLIRSAIMSEQVRWFFTYRWVVKDLLKQNKHIMLMAQGSNGIGGIKDIAAVQLESRLAVNHSTIFTNYFAYNSTDPVIIQQLRRDRLFNVDDYQYQIYYTAWLLAQITQTRQQAGHDISQQPWIILTLYNIGNKPPHAHPQIWWATIEILDEQYTFGQLGMLLYYYLTIYS